MLLLLLFVCRCARCLRHAFLYYADYAACFVYTPRAAMPLHMAPRATLAMFCHDAAFADALRRFHFILFSFSFADITPGDSRCHFAIATELDMR